MPEIYDEVERPARVRLRYLNYQGDVVEEEAEGVFAVCIQHEMDHLDGVLFIDHLSRLKRERAIARAQGRRSPRSRKRPEARARFRPACRAAKRKPCALPSSARRISRSPRWRS